MAMAALLFEEIQDERDARYTYLREMLSLGVWVTDRDGEVLISEMESSHLRNTVAMIEREGPGSVLGVGEDYLPLLEKELERRGL